MMKRLAGISSHFLLELNMSILYSIAFFSILKLFVWVFSGIAGPILNLLHLLLSRISSKDSKTILEGKIRQKLKDL